MNMKMEANIRALLREVKTLQKLVADDAIASESSVERLGTLADRFDKFEANLKELAKQKPSGASGESAAAITTLQRDVGPALAQAVQRLEKMVGLLEKRIEEFTRELPSTINVALRQAVAASAKPSATKQRAKAESMESRSD
jgi:acyl-CoA synthetase (NDP forming)